MAGWCRGEFSDRYHTRSSASASAPRRRRPATISTIELRKSAYGLCDRFTTAVLPPPATAAPEPPPSFRSSTTGFFFFSFSCSLSPAAADAAVRRNAPPAGLRAPPWRGKSTVESEEKLREENSVDLVSVVVVWPFSPSLLNGASSPSSVSVDDDDDDQLYSGERSL
nr:unnamed protein product [Digitaria exilis]